MDHMREFYSPEAVAKRQEAHERYMWAREADLMGWLESQCPGIAKLFPTTADANPSHSA